MQKSGRSRTDKSSTIVLFVLSALVLGGFVMAAITSMLYPEQLNSWIGLVSASIGGIVGIRKYRS